MTLHIAPRLWSASVQAVRKSKERHYTRCGAPWRWS